MRLMFSALGHTLALVLEADQCHCSEEHEEDFVNLAGYHEVAREQVGVETGFRGSP